MPARRLPGADCAPPPPAAHSPDQVHLWTIALDVAHWRVYLDPERLSGDELLRAARVPLEQHRRRFAVGRARLREILGRYLARAPGALSLGRGPYGKPCVASEPDRVPIRFNVSHADELALVAVSWEREVGVDLERVRPRGGIDDLVARHFAPAERLAISRAAPATRLSTFYRYWTLKEACLKGCGTGLREPLDDIDVSRAETGSICLPRGLAPSTQRCWSVSTLEPKSGYVAALAVEGSGRVRLTFDELL
jgi:4'-phosphopantetheinyl transferase